MELIAILISIVAGFGLFGLAAETLGADSRDQLPDDHRR
jgi:hypothetical protein